MTKLKTQIMTKLKLRQNLKTQIFIKLKNLNCDKTKKNSNIDNLKKSNCDKTNKNLNCGKTQELKL